MALCPFVQPHCCSFRDTLAGTGSSSDDIIVIPYLEMSTTDFKLKVIDALAALSLVGWLMREAATESTARSDPSSIPYDSDTVQPRGGTAGDPTG
jgi:hypothetical protein